MRTVNSSPDCDRVVPAEVKGLPMRVERCCRPADFAQAGSRSTAGVLGFAVLLVGGGLSLVATRQLWAIAADGTLSVGGLCNRNLAAFATELPQLVQQGWSISRADGCRDSPAPRCARCRGG